MSRARCANCNKKIRKHEIVYWGANAFCSNDCRNDFPWENYVCLNCGKTIKRRKKQVKSENIFCSRKCFGEFRHKNSIGNKSKTNGYVFVYYPDHPRSNKNGHVYEHILIMENKIGRSLKPGEEIHHKNGIRDDNRPENLKLCESHSAHMREHYPLKKD